MNEKICLFWEILRCGLVNTYRLFDKFKCHYLRGQTSVLGPFDF
jgi:hypothetical protein